MKDCRTTGDLLYLLSLLKLGLIEGGFLYIRDAGLTTIKRLGEILSCVD